MLARSSNICSYCLNVIGTSRSDAWKKERFVDRLRAMAGFVERLPAGSIVLHVDGFDVLFNAPPSAVAKHMADSGMGVIFSAEKGCSAAKIKVVLEGDTSCDPAWPVPHMPTSMPFLNAGVWMGYKEEVLRMLKMALVEVTDAKKYAARVGSQITYMNMGDQTLLSELFTRGWDEEGGGAMRDTLNIDIDYKSRSFLSLFG